MGGGVRVGLEDNGWFDDPRTDPASNPRLVERLVKIARAMGREPATPDQVRERLGIPRRVAAGTWSAPEFHLVSRSARP